jgi:hypothetical protein
MMNARASPFKWLPPHPLAGAARQLGAAGAAEPTSGADCDRLGNKRGAALASESSGSSGLKFQKRLHPVQGVVQRQSKGAAAWPRAGEAQRVLQPASDYLQIGPAEHLLAP